jgi:hypothetical protein
MPNDGASSHASLAGQRANPNQLLVVLPRVSGHDAVLSAVAYFSQYPRSGSVMGDGSDVVHISRAPGELPMPD